jgi:dipeptidyl aminopeptidase/acylaminoacyl peptidase
MEALEISPDGTRAAVSIDLHGELLTSGYRPRLGTRSRFTTRWGDKFRSTWSPDGRRIAYSLSGGNHPGDDVVIRDVAGAGERVVATDPLEYQAPTGFSPDGRFLLYEKSKQQRNDLLAVPLDGGGASRPVAVTPDSETLGRVSPNGRYVAYQSDELGRYEIFVTTFPETGGRWQVSQTGGREVRWSKDGREIFFFAPDNRLMAVEVKIDSPSFEVGAIHPLFQSRRMGLNYRYDVAKDGRRFLVNTAFPGALADHAGHELDGGTGEEEMSWRHLEPRSSHRPPSPPPRRMRSARIAGAALTGGGAGLLEKLTDSSAAAPEPGRARPRSYLAALKEAGTRTRA